MTKRSWYSGILLTFGLGLFLLLSIDYYRFGSAIVEGRFWLPVMIVEPQTVDYGDVTADGDMRQEIAVKNTGRSPLVIERVMPSCSSCIVIHSSPKEPITPGKQEKIEFSMDISKRRGNFETSFIIISNAKPQEFAVVKVTANVLTAEQ